MIIINEKEYLIYQNQLIEKWKNIKNLEKPLNFYKFYRKHLFELYNDIEPLYDYCVIKYMEEMNDYQ